MSADPRPAVAEPEATSSGSHTLLIVAGSGCLLLLAALVGLHFLDASKRRSREKIAALERELEGLRRPPMTGTEAAAAERAASVRALERFVETTKPEVIDANNTLGVFAVSLGAVHGMQRGERLRVFRDGAYVTDLRVDNVQPTASGATIPADAPGREIRKGDRIVRPAPRKR